MDNTRKACRRALLKNYISKPFKRKQGNTAEGKTAESSKRATNILNVSYLQRAPVQLAANQPWYKDDLSRVKNKTLRLLYIEPGQSQDAIAARLVCHTVKDKPRYDALSYSWGEQDDWTEITLDEMPGFAVTQTLYRAFHRLRSTAVARPVWVDAICINQSNTTERNQQVDMMDSTFGNARCVLIWLGDCEDGEFAGRDRQYLVNSVLSKLEAEEGQGSKAWWNRLWVVQEVALAKELMVYFGPHVLTWADFFGSAESKPSFKGVINLRTARAFVQSHGFARKEQVSLEELLALTGNCYASDPLDYVFGLTGLVPGQERLRAHNLYPDYSLTPYELLTRLDSYLEIEDSATGTTMLNRMLNWTASVGHLQLAKLLLSSEQIDLATEGPLALCHAAAQGQVLMLKMLLDDFHLDADSKDRKGRTPLSCAAGRAEADAVRLLIDEYHVDADARDEMGRTPLSWAAARGWKDVAGVNRILDTVQILLDVRNVDPDSEDAKGRTPLAWAVYADGLATVELLLDTRKTNPSRYVDGHPLLAWALEFDRPATAQLLIKRGITDLQIENWQQLDSLLEERFDHNFWIDYASDP